MTSHLARRAAIIITTSAALFALTACTPIGPPAPGSSASTGSPSGPSATPTPTATVAAIDTAPPASLVNLTCNDLGSTTEIQKAYPGIPLVAPTALTAGDLLNQGNALPVADYIHQAGGIECLWDTAPDNNYRVQGVPHPSLEINVLFNAAAAWQRYQQVDFFTGNSMGACDIGICQDDEFINGNTWLDVLELEPSESQQSQVFEATLAKAKAAIKNGGTPATLPALDPATVALGTQCSDFVADSAVQSALGSSAPVTSNTPTGYLDDPDFLATWDGAQDALHDHPCVWKKGGIKIGALSWLPGGAWGWTEAMTHTLAIATPTPLTVPGLHPGDGAWVRCSSTQASCTTDLVIGGNWIEANLSKTTAQPKLAAITAIATAIVAKLG